MGQRHQIYVKVFTNKDKGATKTIALHHQWLYGHTATRLLKNLIKFYDNSDQYCCLREDYWDDASKLVSMIYSMDVNTSYFHKTHVLDEGCADNPEYGDNNDGITIVDFTKGKKPLVAMLQFWERDLVDIEGEETGEKQKAYTPMTPYEYTSGYYDLEAFKTSEKKDHKLIQKDVERNNKYIMKRCNLMTFDDIVDMFPKWEEFAKYHDLKVFA